MYATNYFETMVLNTLRGQSATAPARLYLGLYINNPTDTGTAGTEVSYSGYARQQVTFTTPASLNGGIGVKNSVDIVFPVSGVSAGTITHVGVLDSATGGNMLLYGEFTESVPILSGEAPVIIAGETQWWLTGDMATAFKTKVLNLLRGVNLPGFSPYMALLNGSPESGGAELSGENYARMPLSFSAPTQETGGQAQIVNSAQINGNRATTPWGMWAYTAIYDAATSGTPVYFAARAPKDVRKGMMVVVNAGELKLALH